MSITEVIQAIWDDLPDTFHGSELAEMVSRFYIKILGINKKPFPDTCLHKARNLKHKGIINFEMIGIPRDSKYRKVK